jgi:sialic acid synthase SpsE
MQPLIIAELGTAHGGSAACARELIDAAAFAGADGVKFQIVYADEILHPNTGTVPLPGGDTPLYEVFKKLETPPDFFAGLKQYTESKNLLFLATPFGLRSAAELKSLAPKAVKIASPELNYTHLVREVAGWNIPAYLSTGVSTLAGIESALEFFNSPVCLLHCITAYPAPPEQYNLRLLTTLRSLFGVQTGLSDHSLDPVLVPSIAAALNAALIEKHFCLSRAAGGLDDPIALPPAAFADMAKAVRETAAALDAGDDALDMVIKRFGAETVNGVLGDGVKRLAPAEKANYGRTNRSIHALRLIKKGELITAENAAILRTEKILRPGLPPSFFENVLNRPACRDIPAGEGIRFQDI